MALRKLTSSAVNSMRRFECVPSTPQDSPSAPRMTQLIPLTTSCSLRSGGP